MQEKKVSLLNTILLLVLLAGLAVLYVLFFLSKSQPVKEEAQTGVKTEGRALSIVFVNIDSLNSRYEFVKVLKSDLESSGNRMQNEIFKEQDDLEQEAEQFQRKVSANILSEERAKEIYEDLMVRQQQLMEKKDLYTRQIADQEFSMNMRLLDTVNNFLRRFNRTHGYDYILTYRTAGEILIANDTLDITQTVIDQLNSEYRARQK
jgi:outer membrane protein